MSTALQSEVEHSLHMPVEVDADLDAPIPCYTGCGNPAVWRCVNLCSSRHSCCACEPCRRTARAFMAIGVLLGKSIVCMICHEQMPSPYAEWIRL